MIIDLTKTTPQDNYKTLTNAVFPRPLMWVLTEGEGEASIAPYSFVNILSTEPPLVMLAFEKHDDGELKGTLKALHESGKCVMHLALEKHTKDVFDSAKRGAYVLDKSNLAYDIDGYPPRYSCCPVALYCEFYDMIDHEGANTHLVICKVNHIYKEDGLAWDDLHPLSCVGEHGVIPLVVNK